MVRCEYHAQLTKYCRDMGRCEYHAQLSKYSRDMGRCEYHAQLSKYCCDMGRCEYLTQLEKYCRTPLTVWKNTEIEYYYNYRKFINNINFQLIKKCYLIWIKFTCKFKACVITLQIIFLCCCRSLFVQDCLCKFFAIKFLTTTKTLKKLCDLQIKFKISLSSFCYKF